MTKKKNDMEEIWKDIEGYEGRYQVSTLGRVRSMGFDRIAPKGGFYHQIGRILTPGNKGKGYMIVNLCKDGKGCTKKVHQLVARAFIPNPTNYPHINHKDENPSNNRVDNLEWCDNKYNLNYGNHNHNLSVSLSIPVEQYTLDGEFIAEYYGAEEAARVTGISSSCIKDCCKGRTMKAGGYKWKKRDENRDMSYDVFRSRSSSVLDLENAHKAWFMIRDGKLSLTQIANLLGANLNAISNLKRGVTFFNFTEKWDKEYKERQEKQLTSNAE